MDELINQLVILGEVEDAYTQEAGNWFESLLKAYGATPESEDGARFFKDFEKGYKTKTGQTSMPSVYRSAKSVILQGTKYNIKMWHPALMGKTAIEKAIKEYKTESLKVESVSKFYRNVDALISSVDKIENDVDRENVISYIESSVGLLSRRS